MSDEFHADSVPTSSFDVDPDAVVGSFVCPTCGASESKNGKPFTAFTLGTHRNSAHGYRSPKHDAKPKSAKRTSAGRKASTIPMTSTLLEVVGAMWSSVDDVCGVTFAEQVPALAKAIDVWAQQDPKVYEMIMGFGKTSGPLGVCIALMPVVQVAAIHHVGPLIARRREAAAEASPTAADVVGYVDSFDLESAPL